MERQSANSRTGHSPEEREERRRRVLRKMAEAQSDPVHQRAMFRAKIAGQLTALIASAAKTAAHVARHAGVSASQISRQLSGRANLTLDTVHGIAAAVGASVDLVFIPGSEGQPSQQVATAAVKGSG